MALGSMSLNLALPDAFSTDIDQVIETLVPVASTLDLSIESLNSAKTRLAPRSRDETLDAGRLQLAPGTAVVVDMRKLGEGKLEDTGTCIALDFPEWKHGPISTEGVTGIDQQVCGTCAISPRPSRSKSSRTSSRTRRSSSTPT